MTTVYVWTVSLLLFVSEVVLMGALGHAVWRLAGRGPVGWAAAIGAVVVACVLWGLFAAPKAPVDVAAARYAVKIGLYGGTTALLAVAGVRTSWVLGFAGFSLAINVLALLPPVADAEL
ncbi:DUF2568 domain-containing protein [Rhodococcus rhodnii]|uniref:Uncharacterized protein n=2 Tax=Rhodococcus rhodnii TaxID=38312 RepID=R7WPL5_9NOCA|nr:DUF2568 domain-containing protein [Rhodococcus rhodnii]EOM77252.1 hypothetical protein Rrhod_1401 [Rhodococcus rhodnii LMG 5362]TXG90160.1 DUF2568 domain-containing protein [Rhodococcus rhodnii]